MQNITPGNTENGLLLAIIGIFAAAILLLGAVLVVPAGQVAVITTLWKVSSQPRLPGLNLKIPLIQTSHFFNVRTQVKPEAFSTLTKDLQVIEATATIKYAVKTEEAPRIYSTISIGDDGIYSRIIQPSLLKALKYDSRSTSWLRSRLTGIQFPPL